MISSMAYYSLYTRLLWLSGGTNALKRGQIPGFRKGWMCIYALAQAEK